MSGRVLEFAMHTHDEARRLLPWLANGTLEPGERAWLQQHLEACAQCRRDLEEQQALLAMLADRVEDTGDADAGWQRMRRRIAGTQRGPAPWREVLRKRWNRAPNWLAWTVAAQAALVAALAVVMWWPRAQPATYHTLGHAMASTGDLLIVFDPKLSEAQLRRMLVASDARIVDGPNDAGAYVLAVPAGRAEGVRDALRAAPGVLMVENLAGGSRQ